MKKRLLLLSLVFFFLVVPRAAEPKLDERLAGLEKFLGTWKTSDTQEGGKEVSVTYTLEIAVGGKAVALKGKVSDGTTIRAIWQFDPTTKTILHQGLDSDGNSWKRTYPGGMAESEFLAYFSLTLANGSAVSSIERVKWIDADTWTMTSSEIYSGGKKQGDLTKATYKRVK